MTEPTHLEPRAYSDIRDRFTPFFVVTFAVVTLADIGSTYVCIHHLGLGEVNPFTDTRSFWGLLWPELVAWIIGTAAVRCGFFLGRRNAFSGAAEGCRFLEFRRRLLSVRSLPFAVLLVVPVALVIGRLVPVVGNLSFIAWGIDPFDELLALVVGRFDVSVYLAYVVSLVVFLAVAVFVSLRLVFRLAGGGGPLAMDVRDDL